MPPACIRIRIPSLSLQLRLTLVNSVYLQADNWSVNGWCVEDTNCYPLYWLGYKSLTDKDLFLSCQTDPSSSDHIIASPSFGHLILFQYNSFLCISDNLTNSILHILIFYYMTVDCFFTSSSAFGYELTVQSDQFLENWSSSSFSLFFRWGICCYSHSPWISNTGLAADSQPILFHLALFTGERGFMTSPGVPVH